MCDKKNNVLFTGTDCLVLSSNFKFPDENQILLRVPRRNNMYSVDMKNIIPKESLTCLVTKDILDESMLWHRRLGHIRFKNINKLVTDNLVRGLPSKCFENDQTCVACLKGKKHKASCKSKILYYSTLFMLHMDLFGPTYVNSLIHKKYGLVVTDDYSRYTWVFFLAYKDKTTGILNKFIAEIENLVDKNVKAEAVNTACYVQNRALVVKLHNKTPYELFRGRTPAISFMKPFGFHVTILNTLDHLGKFDEKADEGYFVRYSMTSKAFRVYNIRTIRVEENLHIEFLKNKPIVTGAGPKWLFDIDMLTKSMNYMPVIKGTISNDFVEEEMYVCQPPGFKDPHFPNKVYKVEKALYGLHQAPRAWYEILSTYLLENRFRRGTIGKTLFIKKDRDDAQEIPNEFYQGTHFLLGLQVKQKDDRIFISQDKYVADILKKFDFTTVKTVSTPMKPNKALIKEAKAEDVDVYLYRLMIGSLMYLTASRPNIMFSVCVCASDYAGASLDRKSTTGGCQFLGKRLISWQCKKQTIVANSITKAEYVAAASYYRQTSIKVKTVNEDIRLKALVDRKKIIVNEASIRRDLRLDDAEGTACLPNAAIFEELTRMRYGKPSQKLTFYKAFFSS
nr:ribonuclease H-like domain-containing protein [Tanacetum cinerariifolium]